MTDKLAYTPREAAKALGISRAQVYVLINNGTLKPTRISARIQLIPADVIQALLHPAA